MNHSDDGRHAPADPDSGSDGRDNPSLWQRYEAWLGERAAAEELADLVAWAQATLPAPVMPCVCCNFTCLRCRVAAIVVGPQPDPDLADGPPPF
jgi:hypothetical protein